jgi:hypothetical protein
MTPDINKLFDKLEAIEKDYADYEKKNVEKKGLDYPLSKVHRNYARGLIMEIHDKGKLTFSQIHDEIGTKYPRLRELVDTVHKEVLVPELPGVDLDVASRILVAMNSKTSMKASQKKTKHKKNKKRKPQKRKKTRRRLPLTDERYHAFVQQRQSKKRMSKSDKKSLDKELNQRFCKCVRTVKYSKKIKKGSQYPICMRSIYKNRGFDVPKGVIKNCSRLKT